MTAADRSEMRIRAATLEDAAALASIEAAAYLAAYRGIMPDTVLDRVDPARYTAQWASRLGDAAPDHAEWAWVVERDGLVLGYAITQPAADQFLPPPAGAGEVESLYLRPDGIGRGLGRALFAHAVTDLAGRGFEPLVLWAFEQNTRARRFYESAGWTQDAAHHWVLDGVAVPIVRYRLG